VITKVLVSKLVENEVLTIDVVFVVVDVLNAVVVLVLNTVVVDVL
jgi:hypothetical protein